MLTVDGLADNLAFLIDIGGVLGDPNLFVGIGAYVSIQYALLRIETILALGGFRIVVNLITVVHLLTVEHLFASHGICHIQALNGTLLVLVGLAGQLLLPVQMRLYGVAVFVFLNLVGLIATIGRVCQTLAQNGVAYVVHKLTIHGVSHLTFVHPETFY